MKILLTILAILNFTIGSSQFISITVSPKSDIQFYGKNNGIKSISDLVRYAEDKGKTLTFAMNGGMYYEDYSPMGLFVQEGKVIKGINNRKAKTNFYTRPGVFYVTKDRIAGICPTSKYIGENVNFATQSGPMLVIDGNINPIFSHSGGTNIRNGVGILSDGQIVFAISKYEINFYDFAKYFKELGCIQALFMDGCVSSMYLSDQGMIHGDGYFGVIIGVIK